VAALILGWLAQSLVFWLVLFAWAGLGAALGPTSILALYWKGLTRAGVFAGLITGTLVTFVWELKPGREGFLAWLYEPIPPYILDLYELIPAFLLAFLATVVVSMMTRPPEDAQVLFEAMEGKGSGTEPS
jgi:Na+/proline symporter